MLFQIPVSSYLCIEGKIMEFQPLCECAPLSWFLDEIPLAINSQNLIPHFGEFFRDFVSDLYARIPEISVVHGLVLLIIINV